MGTSSTGDPPSAARILLVDDEEAFRFSAVVALRRGGYRAEEAADGKEALRKVLAARDAGDPFRLVITDIRMPVMSGIEMIDAMREHGVCTEVFAITGFGDQALIDELAGKGCTETIEKPFPSVELLARLKEIFEKVGG
jgi:CheY-like chemotaxis protein